MLLAESFQMLRQAAACLPGSATGLQVLVGPATSSRHRGGGCRHRAGRCLVGYFSPQDLCCTPVNWKIAI